MKYWLVLGLQDEVQSDSEARTKHTGIRPAGLDMVPGEQLDELLIAFGETP